MAYAFNPRPAAATAVRKSATPQRRAFSDHVGGFDDLKSRAEALTQAAQQLAGEIAAWCRDSNDVCLRMENDPEFQSDPSISQLEQQVFDLNRQVNDIVSTIENAIIGAS